MRCIHLFRWNGIALFFFFFFSSRRRHTRLVSDWSSDVCSSDLSVSAPQAAPLPGRTKQPDELNHLRVTSCSSSSCWEVFLPLAIGEPRGKRQAPSQNLHECQQRQTASKLALSLASHTQRADSRRLPGKQRSRRLEIRRESWRVTWTRTRLDQACEPSMLPVCRAGETGQRRKHHS